MTIAAHISAPGKLPSIKNFNYQNLILLAGAYPAHHFIFIFDKPYDPLLIVHENITAVLLGPPIKNRLLRHYWYNFKLPRVLKKYNADLFLSDGLIFSLHTTVKQCIFLPDLSFLQKKNLYSKGDLAYLKKYFKKFIAKAACIIVGNEQLLGPLLENYPQIDNKVSVIKNDFGLATNHFNADVIQSIKDRYTDGKEYFVFFVTDASAENIVIMLKGFSAFKKRQLSNMQLLLAISSTKKEGLVKDFSTYKYRNEVKMVIIENADQETELTAAAYAAVYLPAVEILESKGLLAIMNNIPLITVDNKFFKQLYNEAAIYINGSEKTIADNLMLIYKDENFRNGLVNRSVTEAALTLPGSTATKLWQVLSNTAAETS